MCNFYKENYGKLQNIEVFNVQGRNFVKNCSIIFHFSMCNQCKKMNGNGGGPTDRKTAAKQYPLPSSSSRGGITLQHKLHGYFE
jgi:hypothetical protein